MTVFDFEKVLASSFSALLYGVVFAAIYTLALLTSNLFRIFFTLILTPKIADTQAKAWELSSKIALPPLLLKIIFIFLFGLGFSILSYITLDGIIRLYMIVISILSFYFFESFVFQKAHSFLLVYIIKLAFSITKFSRKIAKSSKNKKKARKNTKILLPNKKKHY